MPPYSFGRANPWNLADKLRTAKLVIPGLAVQKRSVKAHFQGNIVYFAHGQINNQWVGRASGSTLPLIKSHSRLNPELTKS